MVKQTVDEEAPQPHQVKLEQFQESVNDVVHVQKSSKVGMLNRHWTAFFSGPFFKTIPAISTAQRQKLGRTRARDVLHGNISKDGDTDYVAALKRIILDDVDVDGTYGLVNDELVPLPFDCPLIFEYFIDFISGAYLIAQATVVMFIAILVDNDERGYQLGRSYTSQWLPLVKALVICYPLLTLLSLMLVTTEYLFRKYMYYRMLSMRVLVDWENKKLWQGMFFWWFVVTWALMNAWSLYGVIRFWREGARTGADTVQFTTWIVMNLQTMQLLLYYMRLINSEQRLVSLNQIFERAPVEAQMLLTYTYVIEESVLIEECHSFGHMAVSALLRRMANLATCGATHNEWRAVQNRVKFDLERVKRRADNYDAVEEVTRKLREELLAEMDEEERANRAARKSVEADHGHHHGAHVAPRSQPGAATRVEVTTNPLAATPGADAEAPPGDAPPPQGTGDAEVDAPAPADPAAQHEAKADALEAQTYATGEGLGMFARWKRSYAKWVYSRFYGSIHAFYISILVHFPSWPYRGDIPYFRTLLIVQIFSVLSVGAIVVFGVLRATDTSRCTQGNKHCSGCLEFQDLYRDMCPMEYEITALTG